MRRRLGAVLDAADSIGRSGYTVARAPAHNHQWSRVVRLGPKETATQAQLDSVTGPGVEQQSDVVRGMHQELHRYLHGIVVNCRDAAVRG